MLKEPLTLSDDPCATRGAVTTGSQVSDFGYFQLLSK